MSHVRIRYTDIAWHGQTVRLVRIANPPHETPQFGLEGETNPNEHLGGYIVKEVREKFRGSGTSLHLDSEAVTSFNFNPCNLEAGTLNFPADRFQEEDLSWQELTLDVRYN